MVDKMNRTRALALVFLLTAASALAGQGRGPADLANAPVPPGATTITYGSDPLQFGELRLPSGAARPPVAIVVHGGCWVSELGKLDPRAVAIDNMRPMAAALTSAGIATGTSSTVASATPAAAGLGPIRMLRSPPTPCGRSRANIRST